MSRLAPAAAGVLLAAALAGCATRSPPTELYTLAPMAALAAAPAPVPSVAVSGVTLPDHLNRREIVTRPGPHRVEVAELHHWAGALDRAVGEVVAENLSRRLPGARVIAEPWPAAPGSDYTLSLRLRRFEGALGGEAKLDAQWTLRAAGGAPLLEAFRASEPVDGPDYEALVAAQSRLLGRLSEDIAEAIEGLERRGR